MSLAQPAAAICECVHTTGYKVEHTLTAHSGGLEALDARGNFVATCGYGIRLGQVALDNMVKVPPPPPHTHSCCSVFVQNQTAI